MIFKAKFSWGTKKEIINELEHIIGLIEQGYPSGSDWSITGEEKEHEEKVEPEEDLPEQE